MCYLSEKESNREYYTLKKVSFRRVVAIRRISGNELASTFVVMRCEFEEFPVEMSRIFVGIAFVGTFECEGRS